MKISDMEVTLLDYMGDDLAVVNAARVSFDKESVVDHDGLLDVKDAKLIKYLAVHNHWSPFSHCSVKFRVKAPIFVARQLVKHTVGFSWNEVSRRYVDSEPEFFFPDYWRKKADSVKQGSSDEPVDVYRWPHQAVYECYEAYETMLRKGVCPEQARMILPQNTMTEWIWTGTLFAWARMCNLRLDSHTQKETQVIARLISNQMATLFPVSWKVLVNDPSSN